jgi:ABC-type iron transport system FetAB ATPase subunit
MNSALYSSFSRRVGIVEGMCKTKVAEEARLATEVSSLRARADLLVLTEKVLKHLIDKLAKADLERMDKLVTYGLETVFPGRNIQFVSRIEERGKRMRVVLRTVQDGKEVSPDSKSSVQVVESFLLRLICMRKLKRAPFMLLDETFAAVDSVNIDNVGKLITQLSDKTGMDVLVVTHLPQFAEWAQHMYRISQRGGVARVEKIK